MQYISWSLPATYVFDVMKQLINQHTLHTEYLWIAFALNLFYLALASFIFYRAYLSAQKRGGILQVGE
jgi:ABC-2 type transport system permease protein